MAQLFEQHDKDKDGALNTDELTNLFAPCPVMPWGQNLKYAVPTNGQVIQLLLVFKLYTNLTENKINYVVGLANSERLLSTMESYHIPRCATYV